MISSLRPYPEQQDSGVEWIGKLPGHWGLRKIKNLARRGIKTFVDGDWIESPYITSDGIRLIQTGNIGVGEYREKGYRFISEETFSNFGCTEIEPGDILICRLGEPVARACHAPDLGARMITSVDVCILKVDIDSTNPAFLVYSMSSGRYLGWVGSLVRGSTRDRISRSMLGSFSLPLPALPEQTAIARFLDHMDRRIQKFIRAKEGLIALLDEYKQALIHQAVTGQIDVRTGEPYPEYKESGVEWLGSVPTHWRLVPNKLLLRRRKVLVGARHPDYPLLSLTKQGVIIRDVSTARGKFSADMTTFQEVREGDLVFCLFDVPETPRTVGLSPHWGMITGAYDIFECDDPLVARYLEALYVAMDDSKLLKPLYSGLRNTIPTPRFLSAKAPLPTSVEQTAIVRFLDRVTAQVSQAVDCLSRQSTILAEYRARLIADVVTGKLDVREASTGLPELDWLDDDAANNVLKQNHLNLDETPAVA